MFPNNGRSDAVPRVVPSRKAPGPTNCPEGERKRPRSLRSTVIYNAQRAPKDRCALCAFCGSVESSRIKVLTPLRNSQKPRVGSSRTTSRVYGDGKGVEGRAYRQRFWTFPRCARPGIGTSRTSLNLDVRDGDVAVEEARRNQPRKRGRRNSADIICHQSEGQFKSYYYYSRPSCVRARSVFAAIARSRHDFCGPSPPFLRSPGSFCATESPPPRPLAIFTDLRVSRAET